MHYSESKSNGYGVQVLHFVFLLVFALVLIWFLVVLDVGIDFFRFFRSFRRLIHHLLSIE
jgi:hypothetical protein